jgi:uncharacterized phage-associated protein
MYFSEAKVTQMSAYFLNRIGGKMAYLKLMKLLYLCDRHSMAKYGDTMSGDRLVSMRYGPVLSGTLELFQSGSCPLFEEHAWDDWIQSEPDYALSLKRPIQREDLDELSDRDIQVLESVCDAFGHMDKWDLVEYTHTHCHEWQETTSVIPITAESIFKALGKTGEELSSLLEYYETQNQLDRLKGQLV